MTNGACQWTCGRGGSEARTSDERRRVLGHPTIWLCLSISTPQQNKVNRCGTSHYTLYTSSQSANAAPRERERFIRTPLPLTSLDTPRLTSINHAGIIKLIPQKSSTAGIGNFFLRKNLPVSTIRQSANASSHERNRISSQPHAAAEYGNYGDNDKCDSTPSPITLTQTQNLHPPNPTSTNTTTT